MEKNIVFYFSGSGNSLKIARDITAAMENCNIIFMNKSYNLTEKYDKIGFVFPCYGGGMPNCVEKFISELNLSENKDSYYFSVVTYGGGFGIENCFAEINKLLKAKGLALNYGTQIRMFSNYVLLHDMNDTSQQTLEANKAIIPIIEDIKQKRNNSYQKASFLISLIHKVVVGSFANKDKGFNISGNCNGCSICKQICPVDNIIIENNKPKFSHKCEQCMACIHWCPQKAINYKNKTQNRKRYHHPDIQINDMIKK